MVPYRLLLALGLLLALALLVSVALVTGTTGTGDLVSRLGALGFALAVLAGAMALARRGRPGLASLLLLLLVLPGLVIAGGIAWFMSAGFGPHH